MGYSSLVIEGQPQLRRPLPKSGTRYSSLVIEGQTQPYGNHSRDLNADGRVYAV